MTIEWGDVVEEVRHYKPGYYDELRGKKKVTIQNKPCPMCKRTALCTHSETVGMETTCLNGCQQP